jgi:hypothetical protein
MREIDPETWLLIDKRLGVAVLGSWRDADGWTHWAPLPTFDRSVE